VPQADASVIPVASVEQLAMKRYWSLSHLSRKSIAGLVLIAVALATLAAVPQWKAYKGNVDFPCEAGGPIRVSELPPEQRRITYCISLWPRNWRGGSVYARGESDQDVIILKAWRPEYGDLVLQRDGATLVVNGQRLQKGETYRARRFFPSSNPWLLLTAEWRIGTGGLYPNPVPVGTTPTERLSVGGGVTEGWAPGPLGGLVLIAGLALVVLGIREQARRKSSDSHPSPRVV
jgi:hypothetical protein